MVSGFVMGAILRVLSRCIRGEEKARSHLESGETYQDENSCTSENWTRIFLRWQKAKLPMDVCAIFSDAWGRGGRRYGRVRVEGIIEIEIENDSQLSLGQARLPISALHALCSPSPSSVPTIWPTQIQPLLSFTHQR